jgi:hypothetical protein
MNFKDTVLNDINNVFFNAGEFAESHNIGGKVVNCIIDNDRLMERSKKEFDGIYVGELLIFVKTADIEIELSQGMPLIIDKKQMYIFSLREDDGIYEIILSRNAGV